MFISPYRERRQPGEPSTDSQGEEEHHIAGTPKNTKTERVVLDLVEVKGENEVRRMRTHASMEESSPSRGEAGKSVSNNFIHLAMTELKKISEGPPFVTRQLFRSQNSISERPSLSYHGIYE